MITLSAILERKREHVAAQRNTVSSAQLADAIAAAPPTRGFHAAIEASIAATGFALIAEVKRASPSKGLIRADFDPAAHARAYAQGGAACLSVLTDAPFFRGDDRHLVAAREACDLPVLRKDFIIDPWQVDEARALGADAILVIMAALGDALATEIEDRAHALGMDVLVEVHDEAELERAARLRSPLLGINNRDLRDFSIDIGRTFRLATKVRQGTMIVAESGLATHDDITALAAQNIRCALIGESLMRAEDIAAATRTLLSGR